MSSILSELKLSPDSFIDGLVRVNKKTPPGIPLAEKRFIDDTLKISKDIDYIFFRRYFKNDVRTSQAVAYIIDNYSRKIPEETLARLHHTLWLNGTVPLLYIDNDESVDIFSCVSKPVSEKAKDWAYEPLDMIDAVNINEKINRFSASRLEDGTFWEDERNKDYIDVNKSAHNVLFKKIISADKEINGETNPVARRLLLITLLIKYLEDRGVFKTRNNFFSEFVKNAESFYHVLKYGTVETLELLLSRLEKKFNGDIFVLTKKKNEKITQNMIRNIVNIVRADIDVDHQLYFWDIYNFEHIPVEVISHIYQYFTEKGQGAVFTPILLVNLMLDQAMPLEKIKGDEKIFDPTCGSGIFLVSAFRRLVYISQRNNKGLRLNPLELIELLKKSIFGIELQEEAAHIASFSLALAVCDALQPDIIWRELQFKKIIEHNIFIGDFGERGKDALKASKSDGGFDIILGNPPFIEKLTPAIIDDLNDNGKTIPGNQLAYYVLYACIEKYLSETGKICMIQPHGFLYNTQIAELRCDCFERFTVDKILDFISINGLFHDANARVISILARKKKPSGKNEITHLTFRRTIATNKKVCFELDRYDYHQVLQQEAIDKKYTWKANLLGGGRLVQLTKRLSELQTIQEYTVKMRWLVREGYIIGEKKKNYSQTGKRKKEQETANWLFNQPLLVPDALTESGINNKFLGRVKSRKFLWPRDKDIYQSPLMIIEEMDTLKSGFWNEGFLAYTHEFIGIKVQPDEMKALKCFYSWFKNNRNTLQSYLHLCGGRTLAGRGTATQKTDIMNLPYPDNGNFDLVPWEKELLDDIRDYMSEYVRLGQDSKLLLREASDQDLHNYSQTFLRLMNKMYPNLKICKERKNAYLRLLVFSFSEEENYLAELDNSNWLEVISPLIEKEKNVLRTQRILRIYTRDSLIIIKPNKLRYWIRSTAIRDVDDVIGYIFKGEK